MKGTFASVCCVRFISKEGADTTGKDFRIQKIAARGLRKLVFDDLWLVSNLFFSAADEEGATEKIKGGGDFLPDNF